MMLYLSDTALRTIAWVLFFGTYIGLTILIIKEIRK